MNGYKEAANVDKIINHLLEEHPITVENAMEWTKFARTVTTSCKIILETCLDEKAIKDGSQDNNSS